MTLHIVSLSLSLCFLLFCVDKKLKSQVHEIVGRVNGRFGTLTAVPIHHLVRILVFLTPVIQSVYESVRMMISFLS